MKKLLLYSVIHAFSALFLISCQSNWEKKLDASDKIHYYQDSRPWTRWWWFAAKIDQTAIADNLRWLKNNGFGGVEIAWVYPLNSLAKDTVNYTPRQEWLSQEWTEIVGYAKKCADSLGLGCDFTFGTLWPFGDSQVPIEEATMNSIDPQWRQEITRSWEYPKKGRVIDHLNRVAFDHYADRVGKALKPALTGSKSALFCDSWEVETKFLTTSGFEDAFFKRFGYHLSDFSDSLYSNLPPYPAVRYDYMKLLSEYVIEEFYKPFTRKSHELGAFSRAQCSGAPCDIISAYAVIDVPESEALLYEPAYSNLVASAASLSGKRIVTAETFTCLYGWPRIHLAEEQTADLKLLADALFANGVNQIIWHGKPYNPVGEDTIKFYASVHIGSSGSLAPEIPAFNRYLQKVSAVLKKGINYSDVAVYLPLEDDWIAGVMPKDKQFIWAWGEYEFRYTYLPEELKGYRPLWINSAFLRQANYEDGFLKVGDCAFRALYIDVSWMDINSLEIIVELARQGLPICLKQTPQEPGFKKSTTRYQNLCDDLLKIGNVKLDWREMVNLKPLVSGNLLPDYWCRQTREGRYFFFANPKAKGLKFPLEYGQSFNDRTEVVKIKVALGEKVIPITLTFEPYQSLLFRMDKKGEVSFIDIDFAPQKPIVIPRIKQGKERWEVQ